MLQNYGHKLAPVFWDIFERNTWYEIINYFIFKGVIRNPFAFYFTTHRRFSGSIPTLPMLMPLEHVFTKINLV